MYVCMREFKKSAFETLGLKKLNNDNLDKVSRRDWQHRIKVIFLNVVKLQATGQVLQLLIG